MIEAAKVIVTSGRGKRVEASVIAAGLRASTEPYPEDGVDEVLVSAKDEANPCEESLVVQAIENTQYSEVQVFVTNSLVTSAEAKLQELGIPTAARQLSEKEWAPGANYEPRY